jgi:hypothetical protein
MPIEQFRTAKETTDSIQWRIESAHRAFQGAQVRVAQARVDSSNCFLTGTMVFLEHEPQCRGTADYTSIGNQDDELILIGYISAHNVH